MSAKPTKNQVSRRNFLKAQTAALGAAALVGTSRSVFAAGDDKIRIALIGCGGRGTGAAGNNLKACENTEIVAVADAYENKAKGAAGRFNVAPEKAFWGLDAYKKAIDTDCDMVIMATPPGFRPSQYKTAIEAGKHVFMEKPCCVDAPGYRMLVEANKLADENGLKVGVGLQRRHNRGYVNGIKKIHDGKYGDLICLQAYWNGGGIWWRGAQEGWTEMEKQVNNWYHFNWLCGDNICEQHVHNLDVCNWAKNAHPVEANGMGGSEIRRRTFPETQIFDHHFVEFTYPDGATTTKSTTPSSKRSATTCHTTRAITARRAASPPCSAAWRPTAARSSSGTRRSRRASAWPRASRTTPGIPRHRSCRKKTASIPTRLWANTTRLGKGGM